VANSAFITLSTSRPGIVLRRLCAADARAYFDLIQRSRAFLTRYGDYSEMAAASLEEHAANLAALPDGSLKMGIWAQYELAGEVDLNEAAPGQWVLGYWLGGQFCGRGIMSAACQALLAYALQNREVEAFWAGVRHENIESAALMARLGFEVFEVLPERKRYRLAAAQQSAPGRGPSAPAARAHLGC
jgi:RimJ/RimL family protein N-acetyltransferase